MPETSIVMTLKDRISNSMKSIIASGQALSKEFDDLYGRVEQNEASQTALAKGIAETKTAITQQTEVVKQSKRALEDLLKSGDATEESVQEQTQAYQKATEQLERYKNELNEQTQAAKDARKENRELAGEWRTMSKDLFSGSGSGQSTMGITNLVTKLQDVGLTKMVGDSASQLAGVFLESAVGQPTASAVSSLISGTATGAALAGLPGAALGALAGGISGVAQIYGARDDAFKDYYGGLHDAAQEATEERVTSGSSIAGSREQTRMAFARRLGGEAEADAFLDQVQAMAGSTNYSYDEITGYAKSLINSYAPDEIFGVLQSLSDATAGLDLSTSDVSMMIAGLSRMRTTGKATQEYLNYFSERGVDVYDALGRALGVDKSQVAEIVTDGGVSGETAAQAILDYIDQTFGGLSEDLMGTYDAMADNLEDIMSNIQAAGGEGYNEERKKGLAAEQEAYDGMLGAAMSTLSRIEGENRAYLENLSEQYKREALSAVLLGEDTTLFGGEQQAALAEMRDAYLQASEEYASGNQEAGLKMESLAERAEALAAAAYESSDQYQALRETELDQIAAIRENTAALNGWRSDYTEQQERSKGLGVSIVDDAMTGVQGFLGGKVLDDAGIESALAAGDEEALARHGRAAGWISVMDAIRGDDANSHAAGLDRVPYDEYPALLHEGERVLTASEARAQDQGAGAGGVVITGNHFEVREDADIDKIAQALYEKLLLARMSG